ncbi:hypothetical protein V5799_005727 [Amblyomma americanum]|uniref:Uncharacterized protein n=1 Tax=Amblyomma americanum TaxID=6943 RepID=A0AAQ4DYF2_AMBAM
MLHCSLLQQCDGIEYTVNTSAATAETVYQKSAEVDVAELSHEKHEEMDKAYSGPALYCDSPENLDTVVFSVDTRAQGSCRTRCEQSKWCL